MISPSVRDQFYRELGITLTGINEWNELIHAFEDGERKFTDQFWGELLPQLSRGLFQVAAVTHTLNPVSQGIEKALVLIYGVDIFGEPVDKTERILTAVRAGLELFVSAARFASVLEEFKVPSSVPARVRGNLGQEGSHFIGARMPAELSVGRSFYEQAIYVHNPAEDVLTPLQKRPDTCLLMVLNGYRKERGLSYIPEDSLRRFAEGLGAYEPLQGTTSEGAAKILSIWGIPARVVPANLRAIRAALKKGLGVNVAINGHAIRPRKIEGTFVFYEDSWNGRLWKMLDTDFCRLYDKSDVMIVGK
jgi:hypothetical protein